MIFDARDHSREGVSVFNDGSYIIAEISANAKAQPSKIGGRFGRRSNHEVFTMFSWRVKKVYLVKITCVFIRYGPNRWVFMQHRKSCASTHEHPGTRRCTIHPCTLTTLTPNATDNVNSVHIWISLAIVSVDALS